ncbi:helix-turn-helix transcriptional regulator [Pseudonocardia humida]|uniref:AAA family ATPase n=1 Tax=Pseudonocardia humida TaxID=2800819 RepID=A0ABT0ZUU9_9PSEU|nr:AAA family ATPase [Pseudonocardia humida]MCO1654454.1 AAA family ATPase [Pseudonocardia humida]
MSGRSIPPPAVGRILVGRDRERARLGAALAEAAAGRMAAVFVTGEAGVGKSRLVAELVAQARAGGAVVLAGAASGVAGSPPFRPVLSGLRALRSSRDATEPPEPWADRLDELLAAAPTGAAPSRAEVMDLLHRAVLRLAETSVVVLVVEDLQWVDRSTRDLLAYLVADPPPGRVLLVATHRTGRRPDTASARVLIGELARHQRVRTVDVAPLARAAVAELVESAAPGRPELVELVWQRSAGNALIAEQTLLAALDGDPLALPVGLRELVLSRLALLSGDALRAVRAVAVADGPLPHRLLEAVLGGGGELLGALREAADAGIVVAEDAGEAHRDSYRLPNGLLTEVVRRELLPGERIDLHRRYAAALSAGWARELPGVDIRLAHHWHAAGEDGPALAAAVAAARSAEAAHDLAAAHRHWLRAAGLAGRSRGEVTVDRTGCLERAAECAHLAGDPAAAVVALSAVAGSGERARAERAARLAEYLLAAGRGREAGPLLDRAGAARDAGAEVLGARAELLWAAGEVSGAQETAGRLLGVVGSAAPAARARCLAVLGASRRDPAAGEVLLREAVATAERSGDPAAIARTHRGLAELLCGPLDEPARGAEAAVAGADRAAALGMARGAGAGLLAVAAAGLFGLGRWDEAAAVLERAWRTAPTGVAELEVRLARARLSTARGRFADAEDDLAAARPLAAGTPGPHHRVALLTAAADLALWRLRPDLALDHVAAALDVLEQGPDQPEPLAAVLERGARARAELTRLGVRRPDDGLTARSRRHGDEPARRAAEPTPSARAGALGRLAEEGRAADRSDPQAWERVVRAWADLGRPYPTAYGHLRRAEGLLARRANSAAGVTALREAARTAEGLGAVPLLTEVRELAERARVRLAGADPVPAAAVGARADEDDELDALTARELEVLVELAGGRTNREIAGRLFISEKTVGVHVSRIYAKIGVHSRVQASAVLLRCRPERRRR